MDKFYASFEDQFRGSFDLIKTRLEFYIPFILPFKILFDKPSALDLGCGRGEWLELLYQHGFQATGVDLDASRVQGQEAKKLNVVEGDFLNHLEQVESESLNIISAFHFVEHISFEILKRLMEESYRVLKPGGLLILETQNPENLLVGSSSFYLDPTHIRPLPPLLLSFTAEYAQFSRVKTVFLQGSSIDLEQKIDLFDVLTGVSPDYAVIAQKNAGPPILALFDDLFHNEYGKGNRLLQLIRCYDEKIDSQKNKSLAMYIERLEVNLERLTTQVEHLETKVKPIMSVYYSKLCLMIKQLRETNLRSRLISLFNLSIFHIIKILALKGRMKKYISKALNICPPLKGLLNQLVVKTGLIKYWHFQRYRPIQPPFTQKPSSYYSRMILFIKKILRKLGFRSTLQTATLSPTLNQDPLKPLSPRETRIYRALCQNTQKKV